MSYQEKAKIVKYIIINYLAGYYIYEDSVLHSKLLVIQGVLI